MTRKKSKHSPRKSANPPTSESEKVPTTAADAPRGIAWRLPVDTAANSAASVRSGRSSTSSRAAARAALDLQKLEEEKQLEKQFLAKKYDILMAQAEEEEGSVHSRRSRGSSSQRTEEWIRCLDEPTPTTSANTGPEQMPPGTTTRTGTIPKTPICAANRFDVACGGANTISTVNSGFEMNAGSTISSMDPDEQLVRELSALQMRMDILQKQLKSGQRNIPSSVPSNIPTMQTTSAPMQSNKLPRIEEYEFPLASSEVKTKPVSQACSDVASAYAQINTTASSPLNLLPPPAITISSPVSHGPCTTPPSHPFTPQHMSTPFAHSSPSVCTVSAYQSPITTPAVPASASNYALSANPVPAPASVVAPLRYVEIPTSRPNQWIVRFLDDPVPASTSVSMEFPIPTGGTVPASTSMQKEFPIPAGGTVPASTSVQTEFPIPAAGQAPAFPIPAAGQAPAFPIPAAGQVPAFPIPAASQVPAFPIPAAGQAPAFPIPAAGQVPAFPIPAAGKVPALQIPAAGHVPAFPIPAAGQVPAFLNPPANPVPASTSAPVTFPIPAAGQVPAFLNPPANPVPASTSAPVTFPIPAAGHVPAFVHPADGRISVSNSVPMPVPTSAPIPVPIPVPPPTPAPAPVPVPPRSPFAGPTPQQLAARHVVPRDLPHFWGNPTEWPLFLSSFKNSTELCGYSNGENLLRLQKCLRGTAQDEVYGLLDEPSSVPEIIDTLKMRFGNPELLIDSLLQKVAKIPAPPPEDLKALAKYGLACRNLCKHLESAGHKAHLSNPTLLRHLVNKLPASIKLNWSMYQGQLAVIDLNSFGNFMGQIAAAACNVTFTVDAEEPGTSKQQKQKPKEKLFVNTHVVAESAEKQSKPCQICQKKGHKARDCYSLKRMPLEDRWKAAYEHHLCRRCLISHGKYPCRAGVCGENGCTERHHKLLHPGKPETNAAPTVAATVATVKLHHQALPMTLLKILPVTLYGNGKVIQTFAFFDDGSQVTLVESWIAKELAVQGPGHPLCLQWTNNVERVEEESQVIRLEISAKGGAKRYALPRVHTINGLNLPVQSMEYGRLKEQYGYLRGLPVDSYTSAVPTILIGLDNGYVKTPLKVREGGHGHPIAAKTRLGWTIYGPTGADAESVAPRLLHIRARPADQELHELVKDFFALESIGAINPKAESDDDRRARAILEETTTRTPSGRFQTGLLWRYDAVDFPNSRLMAERRMLCLERRLSSEPALYENVRMQLREYQAKGYARKVDQQELAGFDVKRTWYLPLSVVRNPRKPNKVRLIWDAAAKIQGQSFNTALLSGPDLLTPLPAVLCAFRQFKVAITGDIQEMFHRVLIRPEDRSAQLFLWRDDPSQPIEVFMMQVATFGSTCSPTSAQFIKNRNAEEYASQFPRAAEAILKHHYVDDFLYSVDTEEEAVELAQQVRTVHAKAGFHIRNWLSNSPRVLEQIEGKLAESPKCLSFDKATIFERVLGMMWKSELDVFIFRGLFRDEIMTLLQSNAVPTKRQVLRVVMSIFDPLGLVAVFVVHGKILIQNIWRAKTNWDEPISDALLPQWTRWTKLLQELDNVQIPRCYFPDSPPEAYQSLELHIFVDASEEAYAAVAYFRIVDEGNVYCVLVAAKTKVAPLKLVSIPRLELLAAVLGAKLAKFVAEKHTVKATRKYLWSDSKTCLAWLRSDQRRYRPFVAFQVTEALEHTQVEDWRYVPTRLNVADEATKWGKGPNVNPGSRWFKAPSFLYQTPDCWPQELVVETTTEELRPIHVHHHSVKQQLVEFRRFSKWERLVRTVAWVHRYIENLLKRSKKQAPDTAAQLSKAELLRAELTVCKLIQHEAFGDEIIVMTRNQDLPQEKQQRIEKISKIRALCPFLDDRGVVRMDSRLSDAPELLYDFKYPIVLPRGHYGTYLLLDWYHRELKHHNAETAVNEARQRFHVAKMRTEFRQAKKRCQWCKIYKAVPEAPRMAPLRTVRTTPHIRPFTFVGVDYFGPLLIRQGRSEVKRWVALFTCLTIRAVHLEVVHSLSTESCKMAVRRFVGIRGAPAEIYSDRGTNFVGANRDLKRELRQIHDELASTFTNARTQWRFNPPSAPHMGGSWERMVRSVKCALASLTTVRKPNDETLRTLLVEAASIVNSRPLTYKPLDPETQEALTPNCFLMLSTSGVNQPANQLASTESVGTCDWSLCQQLLDQFWRRWIKEYLPTITKRTKWFVDCRPVQAGDLVVVVEDGIRNGWIRGQILRVLPGRDGRVRSAVVKTSSGGVLERPVVKLAVLDVNGTEEVIPRSTGRKADNILFVRSNRLAQVVAETLD